MTNNFQSIDQLYLFTTGKYYPGCRCSNAKITEIKHLENDIEK